MGHSFVIRHLEFDILFACEGRPAMTSLPNEAPAEGGLDKTRIRYLTPDLCKIHLGTHGALHVTVKDERIYGGVYAAYAFPVAYPDKYISLIHIIGEAGELKRREREIEIGVIRDLNEFPDADAQLVREALRRRYFVHTITRLRRIGWKYGFIALDVDSDKGPLSFLMRWQHDRAVDYGKGGKVLIDVDENRYLIPDLEKLSARERGDFLRYIYW
jgi:hypothetical protein